MKLHILILVVLFSSCSQQSLGRKERKPTASVPNEAPTENTTQTSGTSVPGEKILADAFLTETKAHVVPSPFNSCLQGKIEELTAEKISGWVMDTCALEKGQFDAIGGHGVVIYYDVLEKGDSQENSANVAFIPAADKGALVTPATPPASYVVARASGDRKVEYQGTEYAAKVGFDIPLAKYVRKGNFIRIDGVTSVALQGFFTRTSNTKAVYSSVPLMPFDFSSATPVKSEDADFLKSIPQQKTPVSATVVPVHMRVVKRTDGTGNELWDTQFIQTLLLRANDIGKGNFSFSLQTVTEIKDDAQFAMEQWPLLVHWNPQIETRLAGEITAYVSHPKTTGSAGLSWIQVVYTPIIIMRGREDAYHSFAFIDNTAQIFLHEMGHESNLNHSDGSNPLHTDAFETAAWLDHVTKYYQELIKRRGEPPTCIMWDQGGVWKC